jgi:hypothetical protein
MNKYNRLEGIEVLIQQFELEAAASKQKFVKFDLLWVTVNCPNEQITLNFNLCQC